MKTIVVLLFFVFGCQEETEDYCADVVLPECPEACPEDWSLSCGEPCTESDTSCGNDIGDGRSCIDGRWTCNTHGPLEPYVCNKVCM